MAEQVLYRKHRPKHFDEVVGQEHVISAVRGAIAGGRVAHAYLFSGPRGVGKTTMARLIAKSLNCANLSKLSERKFADKLSTRRSFSEGGLPVPCNTCALCEDFNDGKAIDLIEIDAASNRGIDEIRELRDGVRFAPSKGKYKCYIIDEVHQLTKEAFNALLKTLEEPPSHAVFVLATTELDKVPPTIVSRTQHYDFRRPSVVQIAERLALVAKKESVSLDREGAHLVALAAEGSLRDAESILGQIMAVEDEKITRREVEDILGMPRRESAKKMFELIAEKNLPSVFSLVQEVHDGGYDLSHFLKLLLHYYRSAMLLKVDPSLVRFVEATMLPDELASIQKFLPVLTIADLSRGSRIIAQNLQTFKKTPIPQLPLEITAVELITQREEIKTI